MSSSTNPSRALHTLKYERKPVNGLALLADAGALPQRIHRNCSGGSMQIGVYGAGYLGTVVSACLADFGTPVSCCHPDSSQMVAMAQGSIPFHEKNLTEVIKRNVRSGRLAYSTDIESFARKAQVIFLAEDSAQHLTDLAIRIARAAPKPSILTIVTPVPVGTASAVEKRIAEAGLRATIVSQPMFFTPGCAIEDFN